MKSAGKDQIWVNTTEFDSVGDKISGCVRLENIVRKGENTDDLFPGLFPDGH